jgi:hypothetical protein
MKAAAMAAQASAWRKAAASMARNIENENETGINGENGVIIMVSAKTNKHRNENHGGSGMAWRRNNGEMAMA